MQRSPLKSTPSLIDGLIRILKSSEDLNNGNNTGDKVYDLQESTFWKSNGAERLPQYIVIDLGTEQNISAIEYLPRAEKNAPGSMKDYKILVK